MKLQSSLPLKEGKGFAAMNKRAKKLVKTSYEKILNKWKIEDNDA